MPVDDETFVFLSFEPIPAQRFWLEDGKTLRLGSRAFDILIAAILPIIGCSTSTRRVG
jgi:hypothetical protein